jgi:pyrroline-5-carboxylate reductase
VLHLPQPEAQSLFDRLGGTIAVGDEATFNALSAASATVTAHFAYLATVSLWLTGQGIGEAVEHSLDQIADRLRQG